MPKPSAEPPPATRLPYAEFVAMVALLMALNAMAVDIMLPALQQTGASLGIAGENARQLPLTAYVLLFGFSQLFFGPLADRFGRRPVLLVGLAIYAAACIAAAFAESFGFLLAMRAVQGIGAGATRVVALSVIRDTYGGRTMARLMSLVMMVFMAVPILAPTAGQGILMVAGWRGILGAMAVSGLAMMVWCFLRLPETLAESHRRSLRAGPIFDAFRIVLGDRTTFGYAMSAAFMFGCMFSFLNSAQQIYQQLYGVGALFPLLFSSAAILIGIASFANSRLVERFGMRRLSHGSMILFIGLSAIFCAAALIAGGIVPIWAFYGFTLIALGLFGFIGTNFNALAIDPLGHVAGTGSSVIGFLQTLVGGVLGAAVGQTYDGTVLPLSIGFLALSLASFGTILLVERGRLFGSGEAAESGRPKLADDLSASRTR